jgi:hypothetical protein
MPETFAFHPTPAANDQYDKFHYEVGRTLSIWMGVEQQVQQTFRIALGVWQESPADAVFNAAVNLNARLAMANEAVTHALRAPHAASLLEQWDRLYTKAKKQSKRRNAVAHGQVVVLSGRPDLEGNSYAIGARVVDPLSTAHREMTQEQQLAEGISIRQMHEMQTRFQTLAHEIYVHGQEMYAFLRQLREVRG